MYTVSFEKQVLKFLSKLDKNTSKRIIDKIKLLKDNPFPSDSKKLVNIEKSFRIRVGKFRILYRIEKRKIIIVFMIDKRDKVYQ